MSNWLRQLSAGVLLLSIAAVIRGVHYTITTDQQRKIPTPTPPKWDGKEQTPDQQESSMTSMEDFPMVSIENQPFAEGCTVPKGQSLMDNGDTRFCKLPWLHNSGNHASCVPNTTLSYVEKYVSMAVTTGSGDGFFRADLGLCTWMYHVPVTSLYFFTDNVGLAGDRRGQWVEDKLPEGVTFSKEQIEAKGYTLPWIKAQFRFLYGLQYIIKADREHNTNKRWFLLLDDDTFVNLDGLVAKLKELDRVRGPLKGRYLGERGWGGAGHLFDRAASETLLRKIDSACITPYMVKSFHASDVTLQKCTPGIGLKPIMEYTMSHCGASFLRNRMLTGRQVTMHVKRDMVKPNMLAAWRVRLYYQVVYHRNITAYKLLMKVGNCAYGSCKNTACLGSHDKTAMEIFLEHSKNQTTMPGL
eukprot:TRINITY_DN260_c9_g1_i1.p1 TRINITY_DN260_c9_g1~~TRINITY_DN260_c9_g1_i1.p1  ORF type:complete len:414 (+),score=69.91 TRINITY_DN260_c9_g1_i1:85-1326(+)